MKITKIRAATFLTLVLMLLFTNAEMCWALNPQPEPPIAIHIDNRILQTSVSPVIQNGNVLVPMRVIFQALGAQVDWNAQDRTIAGTKGDVQIKLQVGSKNAFKNGATIKLNVAPCLIKNNTMVPLRFIGESFGASVQWEGKTRQVFINTVGLSSGTESGVNNNSENNDTLLNQLDDGKVDQSTRRVTLNNGKKYYLMSVEQATLKNLTPVTISEPPEVQTKLGSTLPDVIDHRRWQTSIKDQGERNTSVIHAVLAGIEAYYKKSDSTSYSRLDLSEQYGNQITQMAYLNPVPASSSNIREDRLGRWGGGSVLYSMALFSRLYGLPEENKLPYINDSGYEDTNQPNDKPRVDQEDITVAQKVIDDINLSDSDFPRAARDAACYGISGYGVVPSNQLNNTTYYKAILAAGYDIAFSLGVKSPDPTPGNGIWNPGNTTVGNQVMLMVGYDENRKVFMVKNSWGGDNPSENGYTLLSYDYVSGGSVYEAAYVTGVVADPQKNYRQAQKFLGRWKLDQDGWKGVLDIYRLPDFYQNDLRVNDPSFGSSDCRIGTYYHYDGSIYRVNGSVKGNMIEFYIDFKHPNLNYSELQGKKFSLYLFDQNPNCMAGSMVDTDGEEYGAYAIRTTYLTFNAVVQDFSYINFAGEWEMEHDGYKGVLSLISVDADGNVMGTYEDKDDRILPVSGKIASNEKTISFTIEFNPSSPQLFIGQIYSYEQGIMSGTTMLGKDKCGWVAARFGSASAPIPPPLDVSLS